eukprot:CAMPEP_0172685512 /NCGR_PEP_ID=MMETSP1074-20121228/20288_1 /TAXON_ID=2916 /ORGANISM="Ceratium fusus, Strain PA161109" /LENGTH=92 /DNA_ID=CAMNT_0013504669 /DNA_START=1002 /DNA_END=1276 /DNA_ORIENTATION=-
MCATSINQWESLAEVASAATPSFWGTDSDCATEVATLMEEAGTDAWCEMATGVSASGLSGSKVKVLCVAGCDKFIQRKSSQLKTKPMAVLTG